MQDDWYDLRQVYKKNAVTALNSFSEQLVWPPGKWEMGKNSLVIGHILYKAQVYFHLQISKALGLSRSILKVLKQSHLKYLKRMLF